MARKSKKTAKLASQFIDADELAKFVEFIKTLVVPLLNTMADEMASRLVDDSGLVLHTLQGLFDREELYDLYYYPKQPPSADDVHQIRIHQVVWGLYAVAAYNIRVQYDVGQARAKVYYWPVPNQTGESDQ